MLVRRRRVYSTWLLNKSINRSLHKCFKVKPIRMQFILLHDFTPYFSNDLLDPFLSCHSEFLSDCSSYIFIATQCEGFFSERRVRAQENTTWIRVDLHAWKGSSFSSGPYEGQTSTRVWTLSTNREVTCRIFSIPLLIRYFQTHLISRSFGFWNFMHYWPFRKLENSL
jgi:hypothetical protein